MKHKNPSPIKIPAPNHLLRKLSQKKEKQPQQQQHQQPQQSQVRIH